MSKLPEDITKHITEDINDLFIFIRDGLDKIEQKEQKIDHNKEILLIIGYLKELYLEIDKLKQESEMYKLRQELEIEEIRQKPEIDKLKQKIDNIKQKIDKIKQKPEMDKIQQKIDDFNENRDRKPWIPLTENY